MKNFITQHKYIIYTLSINFITLYIILAIFVPIFKSKAKTFTIIQSELIKSKSEINYSNNPDSLIIEYKKIKNQIETHINTSVSSSSILKFILENAEKYSISLQDTKTSEFIYENETIKLPIQFKAIGNFENFIQFIAAIEDNKFSIQIESMELKGEDSDKIHANVKLSVLGK